MDKCFLQMYKKPGSYDNKIILQWKNMILNVFYYNLGL